MPVDALAPWLGDQLQPLRQRKAHALLIEGPSGLGQWELSFALVSAWLCDSPTDLGACGECASCHLLAARTHPDLFVLMPETHALRMEWPLDSATQAELDDKKRKPSKEIRADDALKLIGFTQRTAARRKGKFALIYPAERMNPTSANSLLKVLEEPQGELRFVLASETAAALLPTIRSRCQSHVLQWPKPQLAVDWLIQQGMSAESAQVWLRASGGRAFDALGYAEHPPQAWQDLPSRLASGQVEALEDLFGVDPTRWIQTLQKLCHDLLAIKTGAEPKYFDKATLPELNQVSSLNKLSDWGHLLHGHARQASHPLNASLLLELLGAQAQHAIGQ